MPQGPNKPLPRLRSTFADDPEMRELVEFYLAELPRHVEALNAAMGQRQLDEVRRQAHQLRGSSASYGYAPIGDCAAQLEEAIVKLGANKDSARLDAITARVRELVDMCSRASVGSAA